MSVNYNGNYNQTLSQVTYACLVYLEWFKSKLIWFLKRLKMSLIWISVATFSRKLIKQGQIKISKTTEGHTSTDH